MIDGNFADGESDLSQFRVVDPNAAPVRPVKVLEGLGRVRHELRPDRQNLVAGFIFATFLVIFSVVMLVDSVKAVWSAGGRLPWTAEHGHSWSDVALTCPLSIAFIIGGGALFWWAFNNWSLEVLVCESGFQWRTRTSTTRYLWDEMQSVGEELTEERLPFFKGPLKLAIPTQTARDFCIHFKDGRELNLTANTLKGHGILGFIAQQEALARGIHATVSATQA